MSMRYQITRCKLVLILSKGSVYACAQIRLYSSIFGCACLCICVCVCVFMHMNVCMCPQLPPFLRGGPHVHVSANNQLEENPQGVLMCVG